MTLEPLGGGGGIYEDGEPVCETLGEDESVTVPDGEVWMVTIILSEGDSGDGLDLPGNANIHEEITPIDIVLNGGDEPSTGQETEAFITGWSV